MPATDATVLDLLGQIHRFQRAVRCAAQRGLSEADLGTAALAVLAFVQRHEPTRATDMARWLGVGPAVLSRQISDLESGGLLRREPDPNDARAQLVRLTDAGRDALGSEEGRRARLLGELLAEVDDDAVAHAADVLGRLNGALLGALGADGRDPGAAAPNPAAVGA